MCNMPGDCVFNDSWLAKPEFSRWLRKEENKRKAFCSVCKKTLSNGRNGIVTHAKVHMQMSVPDALLATDGDLLCAVTAHHDLYVMRPSETQPLLHMKMATEQRVVSAVFLPPTHPHTALGEGEAEDQLGWHSQSRLYLLDTKQRLYTPTLGPKEPHTALSRTQVQLKQVLPQTPFQALLTAHQEQNTLSPAGEVSGHHHAPRPLDGFDVMNERFSTVESFSKRAQRLLETMMVRRKGLGEPMEVQQGRKEGEEEDVDMTAER